MISCSLAVLAYCNALILHAVYDFKILIKALLIYSLRRAFTVYKELLTHLICILTLQDKLLPFFF